MPNNPFKHVQRTQHHDTTYNTYSSSSSNEPARANQNRGPSLVNNKKIKEYQISNHKERRNIGPKSGMILELETSKSKIHAKTRRLVRQHSDFQRA